MADTHRPSVFPTGGTGYVGRRVIGVLTDAGWTVRALTMGVAWFGVGSALAGAVAQLVIVTLGLVRPSSVAW